MTLLAIETSCDETAVAILRRENKRGLELLASEIASQVAEHEQFGGVVPEVASRNHLVQLPWVLERALTAGKRRIHEIDAFAATRGPGLASSLLVGNSTAKGLAIAAGKPFLGINHLEGHLLSPFFNDGKIEPNVALIVSGGHTLLVNVRGLADYEILGRTLDDAAGEAFDKVAKLLGLGYPGGPVVERRACVGNRSRFNFPRSMLDSGDLNFSFSGLKTAVRYLLPSISGRFGETPSEHRRLIQPPYRISDVDVNDVCASFQQAVIEVLCEKSLAALGHTGGDLLTVSGGVSCNEALRKSLRAACAKNGMRLRAAEPWLCTDNAAMIAFAAMLRLQADIVSNISEEIDPNLALV